MVRIINFMKGYVRMKVWGISVERFMNLCVNKDLLIWGIRRCGEHYEMYISLQGFYQLRPIVRKTSTRVVILKRYGLPFLLHDFWKRGMFLAGFLLVSGFLYLSSFFLWDIEYIGNYRLTNEVIEGFLEEFGVHIGMYTGKLDIESLEKEMRKEFSEITWTSLKLDGSRLKVALKESDAPIIQNGGEDKMESGQDLISPYEGIVVSMVVRSGIPKVSIGDQVSCNMILVEGKVPVYNEDQSIREYIYVDADADILVEHNLNYEEMISAKYTEKQYTGREKRIFFLRLGDKEVKFTPEIKYITYDVLTKLIQPKIFEKMSIPLYMGYIQVREYFNLEKKYSQEEAVDVLEEKTVQFMGILQQKGVQIIEKDVKISFNNDSRIKSGNFTVVEPIYTKQSTFRENNTDSGE